MGVTAVNTMQHGYLVKDRLYAGDDHLHFMQRAKQRPSLKQSAPKWPLSPRRPRRALLRRSFTVPAAMKRPISIKDPAISTHSAAHQLHSSFNPSTSAAPASSIGPRELIRPSREIAARFKQNLEDDLSVDYKEAAAILEQLFSESPSLELDGKLEVESKVESFPLLPSSVLTTPADPDVRKAIRSPGLKKKSRKDLTARIVLHKKRTVESGHQYKAEGITSNAATKFSTSIWSPAASKLLQQHGEVINFTAQNWSRLGGELLIAEEERWLGTLMKPAKALMKMKDALKQHLGGEPSNEDLAQAAKMDIATLTRHLALYQAAQNKLVKMNLRLVKHQARKYDKESMGSSLTVVELCQEGVKGLITAVDRFNPAKGRFSTYAVFWIRNYILRAQTRSGFPIRAPFNFAEIKMKINKVRWEMRLESGEELAGENLMKVLERAGVDAEKYKAVMRSSPRVVSLHKRDSLTGAELIERLADPNSHYDTNSRNLLGAGGGSIEATDPLLRLGIDDVLDSLKPNESLVLRQRFGLDGKGERSLGEIGRNMRLSREMVRRYEARGLLKLKHPARLAYLRPYLVQG